MPLLNNGIFDVKADGGATGDGVADDTAEIQATIDLAKNAVTTDQLGASRSATVYFPPGKYKFTSALTIPSRGMCIMGSGAEGSFLYPAASGARIVTAGGVFGAGTLFRNFFMDGGGAVSKGIIINDEECALENVFLRGFFNAALEVNGGSILHLSNVRLGSSEVLMRVINASAISMVGCNLFGGATAAIEVGTTATDISITGGWAEAFTTFLRVRNSTGVDANLAMFSARGMRFVSTVADARILSLESAAATAMCRAAPVAFRDCTWYLSNTSYAVRVNAAGNTNGSTGLQLLLDNVNLPVGIGTALVTSDVASTRVAIQYITGVPSTKLLSGYGTLLGGPGFGDPLTLYGVWA